MVQDDNIQFFLFCYWSLLCLTLRTILRMKTWIFLKITLDNKFTHI